MGTSTRRESHPGLFYKLREIQLILDRSNGRLSNFNCKRVPAFGQRSNSLGAIWISVWVAQYDEHSRNVGANLYILSRLAEPISGWYLPKGGVDRVRTQPPHADALKRIAPAEAPFCTS